MSPSPDIPKVSEYKVVTIKKVYFDTKTFIWGIVLSFIGFQLFTKSIKGLSDGDYEYVLLLILGLLSTLIGLSLLVHLFSKREKKVTVRKTDDEILDEMIAKESIKVPMVSLSKPHPTIANQLKPAINNTSSVEAEFKGYSLSNVTITLDAYDTIRTFDETEDILDLIQSKTITDIRYDDLLSCVEWKFMRLKVMIRDKFTCSFCNNVNINNHAHHTYYIKNRLPWEIDESALQTLCKDCHCSVHNNKEIPIMKLSKDGSLIIVDQVGYDCKRCNGSGYISHYSHVEGGRCFACDGRSKRDKTFKKPLIRLLNNENEYDVDRLRSEYRDFINDFISKT